MKRNHLIKIVENAFQKVETTLTCDKTRTNGVNLFAPIKFDSQTASSPTKAVKFLPRVLCRSRANNNALAPAKLTAPTFNSSSSLLLSTSSSSSSLLSNIQSSPSASNKTSQIFKSLEPLFEKSQVYVTKFDKIVSPRKTAPLTWRPSTSGPLASKQEQHEKVHSELTENSHEILEPVREIVSDLLDCVCGSKTSQNESCSSGNTNRVISLIPHLTPKTNKNNVLVLNKSGENSEFFILQFTFISYETKWISIEYVTHLHLAH